MQPLWHWDNKIMKIHRQHFVYNYKRSIQQGHWQHGTNLEWILARLGQARIHNNGKLWRSTAKDSLNHGSYGGCLRAGWRLCTQTFQSLKFCTFIHYISSLSLDLDNDWYTFFFFSTCPRVSDDHIIMCNLVCLQYRIWDLHLKKLNCTINKQRELISAWKMPHWHMNITTKTLLTCVDSNLAFE